MHCSVITPIGPGHEDLFDDCERSVQEAVNYNMGPFSDVSQITFDDTDGRRGRSLARNEAVKDAIERGADWLFFLDADDVLLPTAFAEITSRWENYDGIWGLICEWRPGNENPTIRKNQRRGPNSLTELLATDPFLSLQMGHFIRAEVAARVPFDSAMDAGEDFDYYLRIWKSYRCVKLPVPVFINRRGMHSKGARSASGGEWRRQVKRLFEIARKTVDE